MRNGCCPNDCRVRRIYLVHPEVFPVPLIHSVTAPAAVRIILIILPYLHTELDALTLAALWQVRVALVLALPATTAARTPLSPLRSRPRSPASDELAASAVEHQDEHVIKLTEACLRENALRPDPRYPAAVLAAQHRSPPLTTHLRRELIGGVLSV
jgi:hypothetical protein